MSIAAALVGFGSGLTLLLPLTARPYLRDDASIVACVFWLTAIVSSAAIMVTGMVIAFSPGVHLAWFLLAAIFVVALGLYGLGLHRKSHYYNGSAIGIVALALVVGAAASTIKGADENSYRLTSGTVVEQGSAPGFYVPVICSGNPVICTGGYYEPPTWELTILGSYNGRPVMGVLTFYSDVLPSYPVGSHYPS